MYQSQHEIPFNKPSLTGRELDYILEAIESKKISGNGLFAKKCCDLLQDNFSAKNVLLTPSCTHALELSSILLGLKEGDEVIVPSFTISSTVNAFMLRGAKPVFIDIRLDTKNIDENLIEERVSDKTKAIYPVHYAGVPCNMNRLKDIAEKHGLFIVEDAAHALGSKYKDDHLGTLGTFGCYSFHETKNFICGEGGALVINDDSFTELANIIQQKGTNRHNFFKGEIDKYTWIGVGSSYLMSDILAAFLYAQLENMSEINKIRKNIFERYVDSFRHLEQSGKVKLPYIPSDCHINYHMFYLMMESEHERDDLIKYLDSKGIAAVFHFVPLHTSPMGLRLGYKSGDFPNTEYVSQRLIRLPFYNGLTEAEQDFVIQEVNNFFALNMYRSKTVQKTEPLRI